MCKSEKLQTLQKIIEERKRGHSQKYLGFDTELFYLYNLLNADPAQLQLNTNATFERISKTYSVL